MEFGTPLSPRPPVSCKGNWVQQNKPRMQRVFRVPLGLSCVSKLPSHFQKLRREVASNWTSFARIVQTKWDLGVPHQLHKTGLGVLTPSSKERVQTSIFKKRFQGFKERFQVAFPICHWGGFGVRQTVQIPNLVKTVAAPKPYARFSNSPSDHFPNHPPKPPNWEPEKLPCGWFGEKFQRELPHSFQRDAAGLSQEGLDQKESTPKHAGKPKGNA